MKFEFGDLYKFIVSLGVVIISLSILVPWLFLKEPFDLLKTDEELKKVSDVARSAILSRQESVAFILRFIPWFSSLGCIIGSTFIYLGLKKWHRNQLLLDEQTKIEVEIKKQSLRDATKDEIAAVAEKDFQALPNQKDIATDKQFSTFQASYLKLEQQLSTRLHGIYDSQYEVESNKIVGGIEIDILLRGKSLLTKDYIIELKTIKRGFNYGWLRESFLKNVYAKNIYAQLTNRIPNTLLLIVTDFQDETPRKYNSLLEKITNDELGRRGKDRVVMLTESELDTLNAEEFQKKIGIYA